MDTPFANRRAAGIALAQALQRLALTPPIVVLALPRGGVPVAAEVARALGAALDLVLVRKIGSPWQPELAVGAVVDGDAPDIVFDEETLAACGLDHDYVLRQSQRELREIERRREAYLRARAPVPVKGATVIVVDDGLATGTTMRAALRALRKRKPARLVLAVPVAPRSTLEELSGEFDQVVCLSQPFPFRAIGEHYVDFRQLDDHEVIEALDAAQAAGQPSGAAPPPRR